LEGNFNYYDVFQDLKQTFFPKDKGRMQFIKSLKTVKWNFVGRTQNKPQWTTSWKSYPA